MLYFELMLAVVLSVSTWVMVWYIVDLIVEPIHDECPKIVYFLLLLFFFFALFTLNYVLYGKNYIP